MNIVEMHERVRFWLDIVRSPRMEAPEIDGALSIVIDKIVDEKYTHASALHAEDSFQKTQKIRDQLGAIVKRLTTPVTVGEETTAGGLTLAAGDVGTESHVSILDVSNFRHMLDLAVFEDSEKFACWPTDLNHRNLLESNPFRRPRRGPYPKFYYAEEDGRMLILHMEGAELTAAEMFVLRQPVKPFYGFEKGVGPAPFPDATPVIASEKGTIYAGVQRNIGEEFSITAATDITGGMVVHGFVNCELSITLHEEITRRAAVEILRSTDQTNKVNMLMAEFKVG